MKDFYLDKHAFKLEENTFDINFWWIALKLLAIKINDKKMKDEHDWDQQFAFKIK